MAHANSLRVIGQSLEVAKLLIFELETDGRTYFVSSDSLTQAGEWVLRSALGPNGTVERNDRKPSVFLSVGFSSADISRLDEQAQKQRRLNSAPDAQAYSRISQLLRTLGDHLDRSQVSGFHLSCTSDSVLVDFQSADGRSDSRTFAMDRLRRLGAYSKFKRSRIFRYGIPVEKKRVDF